MPSPTTTLLIEGSFTELAEEFSLYLDSLRKDESSSVHSEIAPLLEPLRQAEQNEEEANLKQRDEVLKKIVLASAVLNTAPEKDITQSYNLLVHLIHQSSNADMFLPRVCAFLVKPIQSSPQFGPSLAISILTTIFNTLSPTDSSRYHVLLAVIAVVRQTNSTHAFEALKPQLMTQLPTWLATWELDDQEARKLHLAISDAAAGAGDDECAQAHLLEALLTIPADEAASKESRELAIRALTSALLHRSTFDFTPLTASDAIQALRSSDPTLFELLEIFTADTLDAYEAFVAATPLEAISGGIFKGDHVAADSDQKAASEVAGTKIDVNEALQTKMRLLTLSSLAASAPSRSLPYATISSALRIPAADVEKWVIDTIRAGLVEGKLSQLRSEFLVHRATYRVFGERQWTEVQGRLMVWRRSLENVLAVIRAEKERFARESAQTASGEDQRVGDRQRTQALPQTQMQA